MSDNVVTIASTTDTPAEVKAALPVVDSPASTVDTSKPADRGDRDRRADSVQEKIDYLTWQKNHLLSEREQVRQENERLRGELAGRRTAPPADDAPTRPAEPRIDDFATVEDWTKAMVKWTRDDIKADLESRDRTFRASTDAERFQQQQAQLVNQHLTRIDEFRKTNPDFDELAQRATDEQIPITPMMQAHVLNSELGPDILYELAKDPRECRRIAALPQGPQLVALGKLESRIEHRKVSSPSNTQPAARPVSAGGIKHPAPPPPIKPNGGTPTKGTKSPDEMSFQEYKEWRRRTGAQ